MRLIVRRVKKKGASREVSQEVISGDLIGIGRGSDQSIQIADKRIPLSHSQLIYRNDSLFIQTNSGNSVLVNNEAVRSSPLLADDLLEIAGYEIKLLQGDDGADFILEINLDAQEVQPLQERFNLKLADLKFPQRRLSWFFFITILFVGLGSPLLGYLVGFDALRESPLPDDGVWMSGDLHPAHAFTGENCQYCHQTAFVSVTDEACLSCHQSTGHHFDQVLVGNSYITGSACQDCHGGHAGEDITREDQELCATCHQDMHGAGYTKTELRAATDFLKNHPSFKVAVNEYRDEEGWSTVRWDQAAEEPAIDGSNLIFPHDVHVQQDGINGPYGKEVLGCDSCHQVEPGGGNMLDVSMEKHCASCHELTFDPLSPDRYVPHGEPKELIELLEGYYAFEYLQELVGAGSSAPDTGAARRPVRRPGSASTLSLSNYPVGSNFQGLSQEAIEYVSLRVTEAASNLFERQTCVICHEITLDPAENEIPWSVAPVKLTDTWMPKAVFSHERHENMSCSDCHEAETSSVATDVLMPEIDSCQMCHGGEHAQNLLQSNCLTCHEFHYVDQPKMIDSFVFGSEASVPDSIADFIQRASAK